MTRRLLNPQPGAWGPFLKYRYASGDRLWVKETSAPGAKIIPSIFMKRKDSRLTLEITGVKVERVQDISAADAIAEGMQRHGPQRPQDEFQELWDRLNADRMDGAASWACNPWIYALTFRVHECNIDVFNRENAL